MSELPPDDERQCTETCRPSVSIDDLNHKCFCVRIDRDAVNAELQNLLDTHPQATSLAQSHPNLFASLPVYVSRGHLEQIRKVAISLEEVVKTSLYQLAAMAWAPEIARFDPGSPGGLLGIDFHLSPEGPRLIEINTNPGGALLNALLSQAQDVCAPGHMAPPTDPEEAKQRIFSALLAEWQFQRGNVPLTSISIMDEAPREQYLYPEFLLYRALLQNNGVRAGIHSPEDVAVNGGRVTIAGQDVDMIYNRMTDFALHEPANATLREAYRAGQIVLSPHPRAHALYADKRNLSLLGDRHLLQSSGISETSIDILEEAVPTTVLLSPENHELLWADRRKLFFKPATGFGSKASYRGDKLTRRVWAEILGGTYVAQQIVAPSSRSTSDKHNALKVDIRAYTYGGNPLLYAARLYSGQTTNFRTPGGGFSPVLTDKQT